MRFCVTSGKISSPVGMPIAVQGRNGNGAIGFTSSKAALPARRGSGRSACGAGLGIQTVPSTSLDRLTAAFRVKPCKNVISYRGDRLVCEARSSRESGYSDVLLSRSQLVNKPVITRTSGVNLGVVSQARRSLLSTLILLTCSVILRKIIACMPICEDVLPHRVFLKSDLAQTQEFYSVGVSTKHSFVYAVR
eukprot:2761039-Pyramimonas_sp.AAC.1